MKDTKPKYNVGDILKPVDYPVGLRGNAIVACYIESKDVYVIFTDFGNTLINTQEQLEENYTVKWNRDLDGWISDRNESIKKQSQLYNIYLSESKLDNDLAKSDWFSSKWL